MMDTFLLSLTVLLAGGLWALLAFMQFKLMKAGYIALSIAGSVIGLYALQGPLQEGTIVTFYTTWLHLFTLSFSLDSLSAFFLIPIFAICPLAVLYSFHYMDKAEQCGRVAVNYFFLTVLVISMALVATADNLISFALAWEAMSLSSFFLVMHEYQKKQTRKAGYMYFIFTHIGAMFIFAAFALAYSHTRSFYFLSFAAIPETIKVIVFFLALIGFGSKAGIFPLHIWLPQAHPAAPSNVSAVMSGVMIKMGIYGILRLYASLGASTLIYGEVVLILGIISGILGVVYAMANQDLKKLLAYCSVENIGIILIGIGIGMIGIASDNIIMASFGFAGGLLHVLNHSIFKSLLFLGAGGVLQKTGIKHIDQLGGLMKKMPTTGKTFLVGSVSISGLPPFNGFISEFLIYYGAFHGLTLGGASFIFTILAILSLAIIGGLAAACFSKVVGLIFLGEPRCKKAADASEPDFTMTLSMIVLAGACVVIGLFPEPFIITVFQAIESISVLQSVQMDEVLTVAGNLAFAARLCFAIVLVSILIRKVFYLKKDVSSGATWGCGFTQPTVRIQYTGTSYAMSIVEFFRPFVDIQTRYSGIRRIFPGRTTYSSHIDDIAEKKLMERIVTPVLYLLGKLRWIQHGHIQLYIAYIVATIIVLLFFI